MNREVYKYLKSYSSSPEKIDRLIVSAFLSSKEIKRVKNKAIQNLIIPKESTEYSVLNEFLDLQKIETFEELIEAFEFVVSPEDKVITGAVYTPKLIRNHIVEELYKEKDAVETKTICDPACGCGGFLYTSAIKLKELTGKIYYDIFKDNLYGLDIQEYSINRAKIFLSLLAITEGEDFEEFEFNLYTGNALSFSWDDISPNFSGFDFIIGNPPYVCSRNIDFESKELLKNWSVCSSGHPDLYIPFFQLGIEWLSEKGKLGFITMNTFFKSINGRALREYFNSYKYQIEILDFGSVQVFDSKSTYTCICTIKKSVSAHLGYLRLNSINQLNGVLKLHRLNYESLDDFNGWNLEEVDIITKIESIGIPLGERFKTRNGIATLKNNVYIFNPINEDEYYYYLEKGEVYPIEKQICTSIINPNKFTTESSVNKIRQQIIFPYTYQGNKIQLLSEESFRLNYPNAYEYLLANKEILAKRDKGNGKYENWYAYGRNQSLEKQKYKLFFPHITSSIPNYVFNDEEDLLFYNGLAMIGDDKKELLIMKKIMSSRLFWFYITKTSKPYGSGYFSLSRNYIKKFGIAEFTKDEASTLLKMKNQTEIDSFIESKYEIDLQ